MSPELSDIPSPIHSLRKVNVLLCLEWYDSYQNQPYTAKAFDGSVFRRLSGKQVEGSLNP